MRRHGENDDERSRSGRSVTVVALAIVAVLLAASCGSASGTDDAQEAAVPEQEVDVDPVSGGKLVYGLAGESNGWDPVGGTWAPWSLIAARTIFDTLTVFDENGDVPPYLAESLTPNEDLTEWIVRLRPGVTFHNGEVLDAEALKANWDYLTQSPLTGPVFNQTEGQFEVISELEVKATYPEPYATFPEAWATQLGVVMAPESLTQDGPTRARNPIGTGPFTLDEWIIDSHLTVIKNPDYWQEDLPYVNEIEFRPIADPTSRRASLEAGDLDLAFFDNPTHYEGLEGDDGFLIWQDPETETAENFIMFNTQVPPFDNPDLRRALVMATDSRTFTEVMTPGREQATGPYKESSRWWAPTEYPGYDPDAARALVEEIEASEGEITVTLGSSASVSQAEQVQLIAQMWQDAGVDVEIGSKETASLIIDIVTGQYESVLWRQFDSPSPGQETVWWHEAYVNDPGVVSLNFARNVRRDIRGSEGLPDDH